ncbi:MAG: Hpt domain-containing protein [Anaerolineae bacterium]
MTTQDLSDYLDLFLGEAREYLERMDHALVLLERAPGDPEAVATLFRAAHTLKGLSAGMGYGAMAQVAHVMEDLFSHLQRGRTSDPALVQVLFEGVDLLREFLDAVEAGQERAVDLGPYLRRLEEWKAASFGPEGAAPQPAGEGPPAPPEGAMRIRFRLPDDLPARGARAYVILRRLAGLGEVAGYTPSVEEMKAASFGGEVTLWLRTARSADEVRSLLQEYPEVQGLEVLAPQESPSGAPASAGEPSVPRPKPREREDVRVRLDLLERLTDLMAELVVSRARLEERVRHTPDEVLQDLVHEQGQILDRLQEAILDLRMVPAGTLLHRYPRIVRDLLRATGKEARLILEGTEIQLDRAILNRLDEPLIHLIRNAVAHGLETPEERARAGKPREGTLVLRVTREQDAAVVEVSDDGRGLDRKRILRAAVERGILRPEDAARLPDPDVWMLICHRDFSTAEGVTTVSGRGVGMGVVKEAVEEMRGELEIASAEGKGTTFRIRVPLTLAILQALVVQGEGQLFAIPMGQVTRVVSLTDANRRGQDLVMDGRVVPVWDLVPLLAGAPPPGEVPEGRRRAVVVGRARWEAALAVDDLLGIQEVVVRPLKGILGDLPTLDGAVTLPDGRVALVLNIPALLREAAGRGA